MQQINNEKGRIRFVTEDCVYLSYSGGAANGYATVVGVLDGPRRSLDPATWQAKNFSAPVLHYQSVTARGIRPGRLVYFPRTIFAKYAGLLFHGEVSYESHERCASIPPRWLFEHRRKTGTSN